MTSKKMCVHFAVYADHKNKTVDVIGWGGCIVDSYKTILKKQEQHLAVGTDIDGLMVYCYNNNVGRIYVHDDSYELSLILSWLLKNKYSRLNTEEQVRRSKIASTYSLYEEAAGSCYGIYIKYAITKPDGSVAYKLLQVWSSRLKLRASVDNIRIGWGLTDIQPVKNSMLQLDDNKINDEDFDYLLSYSIIVATALNDVIKAGCTERTASSDAKKFWLKTLKDDGIDIDYYMPRLPRIVEDEIRNAYRGGITWLKTYMGSKKLGIGTSWDMNSMYPAICCQCALPYGPAIKFDGCGEENARDMLYIQCIYVEAQIKKGHVPCITTKRSSETGITIDSSLDDYINSTLWLTNYDVELLFSQYDVKTVKYFGGYKFNSTNILFKNYMEHWYYIKSNSKFGKKEHAKIMLNALTGGFGIKRSHTSVNINYDINGNINKTRGNVSYNDKLFNYLPVIIFITALGRYNIVLDAQKHYDRLIYIDTDSIHLLMDDVPDIDVGDGMGQYKLEAKFYDAIYIKQKTYIHREMASDGSFHDIATMAGAVSEVRDAFNLDNFKIGVSVPGDSRSVSYRGGNIRVVRNYTIS